MIALVPSLASGHVERASYFPDPGVDFADGQPAGGAVPQARDLFTALDEGPVGETRVVCAGGQSLPYRANQPVSKRSDVEVSRKLVDRLKRKLKKARNKGQKRKAKRVKRRLRAAKKRYRAALAAEQSARQSGESSYQQRLAAELAARQAYESQLATQPSMQRLDAALDAAVANGYEVRPSEPRVPVSQAEADRLRDFNARLLARCEYDEIQPAVNDSGNNDRVVVMPGVYTEPTSRQVETRPPPERDPCEGLEEANDTGSTGALSYRYQFHCPNDQNLIAVMGREPDKDEDGDVNDEEVPPFPEPDDPRRAGIPDANGLPDGGGNCIRCNLQLEGSGISADDVVVDSGDPSVGNHHLPGGPDSAAKDVGIRIDRADGFVLRNMTVRHSVEHDIYSPETDGLLLERFKTYFNGHYGVLTFTADHHLIQDCDAAGSGDAAIYPGSSAEYGEQTNPNIEADSQSTPHTMSSKYSTEIRRCDMRHSNTGYSGTAANSVWIHNNDFYDNAMGLVTDVFTASGHPGFPQDSDLIENNEFYSNNFNLYVEEDHDNNPVTPPELAYCGAGEEPGPHGPNQGCTDVVPKIPAPVGTAMFLPGVNNNTIRNNHMWNNWRRGTMLFAVPDNFVCGNVNPVAGGNQQHGCDETEFNTSHRNEQHHNAMGRSPNHAPDPTWDDFSGGSGAPNAEDPNGLDFWWDQGGTPGGANYRNCWYDNTGQEGDEASVDSLPEDPLLPGESGSAQSCATSVGAGSAFGQLPELLNCLGDYEFDTNTCDWFVTPNEPQPTP